MDVFRVFDALNDVRNLTRGDRSRQAHRQARPGHDLLHRQPAPHGRSISSRWREQLVDMGCDSICIKDMAGLLKPQPAYDIVQRHQERVRRRHPGPCARARDDGRHDGQPDEGDRGGRGFVDTAISSMSLGPGTIRPRAWSRCSKARASTRASTRSGSCKLKRSFRESPSALPGVPVEHHRSRNRNLRQPDSWRHDLQHGEPAQAAGRRATGCDEVLEEVPRVRKDAGYPPLVTPSSQIVGTQAVFNVLMGRYKVLTGEFADLMLGYYGSTMAEGSRGR